MLGFYGKITKSILRLLTARVSNFRTCMMIYMHFVNIAAYKRICEAVFNFEHKKIIGTGRASMYLFIYSMVQNQLAADDKIQARMQNTSNIIFFIKEKRPIRTAFPL